MGNWNWHKLSACEYDALKQIADEEERMWGIAFMTSFDGTCVLVGSDKEPTIHRVGTWFANLIAEKCGSHHS